MAKFVFNASVFDGSPLYASTIATQVSVIDADTLLPADIWEDRDGITAKSNPFTISEAGVILFYADPGRYNITAVNGGDSKSWNDHFIIDPTVTGDGVLTLSGGDGINVDNTDPANPSVASDFSPSQKTASYTLSSSDSNSWAEITGAANVDIECPLEATDDLGSKFVTVISNLGTGTVTITAEGAATVTPPAGGTLVIPQFATVGIKKLHSTSDSYIVFGPTTAV